MRKLLLATPVLALTTGCLFGPPGNALGLEGEYVGTLKSDLTGAFTEYSGGQTTNYTTEGINDQRLILVLERGYGDVDAVLSGLGCPALLTANGNQLTLMEDAECISETDQTVEVGGQSVRSETVETMTITDVTVTSSGSGTIKIEASANRESEERRNDERTQTSSIDVDSEFSGVLVGGE